MIGAIAQWANLQGWRVAVLLNMSPLVNQAVDDLKDFGLDGNISIISGGHDRSLARSVMPNQVAMLQTIANRPEAMQFLADADLVIFDEFHTSKNFQSSIDFLCGDKKVVAFSATPYNSPLGDVVDDAVLCPPYLELQKRGYLVPLKYSILTLPEAKPGQKRDLNSDEGVAFCLQSFLNSEGVRSDGATRALFFAEANRTGGESHCSRIKRIGATMGLNLVIVDESMSGKNRDDAIAACHNQTMHGLVCVEALAVGVDIKSLRHVNLLSRVGSRDRFVQKVGRVTRTHPESGKTCGWINDFAGNLEVGDNGGLHPFIERLSAEISREQILNIKPEPAEGEAPFKICPDCETSHHPTVKDCWACGYKFPEKQAIALDSGIMQSFNWWEPQTRELS